MQIYQFHVKLEDYKPAMWRRFLIESDMTVADLSYVVLSIFRADVSHLFNIKKPAVRSSARSSFVCAHPETIFEVFEDDDFADFGSFLGGEKIDWEDAKTTLIKDAVSLKEKDNILYINYDFGDDWLFKVKLEKIFADSEVKNEQMPCVKSGKGYGIIEDCGGAYGLMQLREAAQKMSGEAYEQYRDWINLEELDLDYFNLQALNEMLKKEFPLIKGACENPPEDEYYDIDEYED